MVSAKQGDNSVAMAIQSLVRHMLEKKNIPRKWKPVDKPKKEKKPVDIHYDKLKKVGIEKVCERIGTMRKWYCKFGNFHENFIFANWV